MNLHTTEALLHRHLYGLYGRSLRIDGHIHRFGKIAVGIESIDMHLLSVCIGIALYSKRVYIARDTGLHRLTITHILGHHTLEIGVVGQSYLDDGTTGNRTNRSHGDSLRGGYRAIYLVDTVAIATAHKQHGCDSYT